LHRLALSGSSSLPVHNRIQILHFVQNDND
jgi:hypothetical protein